MRPVRMDVLGYGEKGGFIEKRSGDWPRREDTTHEGGSKVNPAFADCHGFAVWSIGPADIGGVFALGADLQHLAVVAGDLGGAALAKEAVHEVFEIGAQKRL